MNNVHKCNSETLKTDVENFLESGGKIAVLPNGEIQKESNKKYPLVAPLRKKVAMPLVSTERVVRTSFDKEDTAFAPAVLPMTGFSRSDQLMPFLPFGKTTLYKLSQSGAFPAPIRIGERMTAWSNAEVHQWFQDRMKDRVTA